ncbi:PREDICTED: putative ribonuclease [Condylura cristata]|uniref:putative ribonuclease n=1 Tax=Condylura cristata TaxID=143302 RepID=UPI000642FD0E|nr:PREDICTED: putative ribonuclease [Condylura cristata]
MRRLNRRYRGRDCPTDVLAFPFLEGLCAGQVPSPARAEDRDLGTVVLGVEFVRGLCGEGDDYYGALTLDRLATGTSVHASAERSRLLGVHPAQGRLPGP